MSYSDLGDPEGKVVVFCGGMFGTRYTLALVDQLARDKNIRLISPDKPGIGGSSNVGLQDKIDTWLETLDALVQHLNIENMALVGHSSGAIYVLNSILRSSNVLNTERPYVALVAPWVHPMHSRLRQPYLASLLPDSAVRKWYQGSHLISRNFFPAMGPSTSRPGVKMTDSDEFIKSVDAKVQEYALAENVEGVGEEAVFCLRRKRDGLWGPWNDYDEYPALVKGHDAIRDRSPRLRIEAFYAENDDVSGKQGTEWFDGCWKNQEIDGVTFTSTMIPDCTHETITRAQSGLWHRIFESI